LPDTLTATVRAPDPSSQLSAAAADAEELSAMSTKDALAQLRSQIEGRLDDATRWRFSTTANAVIQLGNRKPKLIVPRRQKIRNIVEKNRNIAKLYNEYATLQATIEKRVTYRLPVFLDLEIAARGGKHRGDKMEVCQGADETMEGNTTGSGAAASAQTNHNILADATEKTDGEAVETPIGHIDEPMADTGDFSKLLFEAVTGTTEGYNARREQTDTVAFGEQASGDLLEQLASHAASSPQTEESAIEALGYQNAKGAELWMEPTEPSVFDGRKTHEEEADKKMEDAPEIPKDIQTAGSRNFEQVESGIAVDLIQDTGEIMITDEEKEFPTDAIEVEATGSRPTSELVQERLEDYEEASTAEDDVSVKNPGAFPVHRIQEVQAGVYPNTRIVKITTHVGPDGIVRKVTADVEGGFVDHFIIKDARIIAGLGLSEPPHNIITSTLRAGETFKTYIPTGQHPTNIDPWFCRVLKSARHAFLYWLDLRNTADPRGAPFWQEARLIARDLDRRAPDVFREISNHWNLEQGAGGSRHRANRIKLLGEDPRYAGQPHAKICMWG
jgi:hypothetical protein